MTNENFNEILESRISKIRNVLATKAAEYSRNDDKLHNFNVGAKITNKPRESVLYGMDLKHYISIKDIILDIEKGNIPTYALVNEKITDHINYMILLEACIIETIKEDEERKIQPEPSKST